MTNPEHTEEFNAQVAKLWNDGYSAGYIGIRMGVTRNAIIGVVHRIKGRGVEMREGEKLTIHRKPKDEKRPKPSMPKLPETVIGVDIGRPGGDLSMMVEIQGKEIVSVGRVIEHEPLEGRWVSHYDLKNGCCRYIKDNKFCNAEGFPWCDEHHALVTKKKGENR